MNTTTLPSPPTMGIGRPRADNTGMRWAALCEAGMVICALARMDPERPDSQMRNLPTRLRDCDQWRRAVATDVIEDLSAVVEVGLSALLAINARGADCSAAARALWQEFVAARTSLVELLPPAGQLGPLRSA